jgi:hypothetical protein
VAVFHISIRRRRAVANPNLLTGNPHGYEVSPGARAQGDQIKTGNREAEKGQNAEMGGVTLARQIREGPPELAFQADVKKPETSSGFGNWWCRRDRNPTHSLND